MSPFAPVEIEVFQAEREAGLEKLIRSSNSFGYTSAVFTPSIADQFQEGEPALDRRVEKLRQDTLDFLSENSVPETDSQANDDRNRSDVERDIADFFGW